MKSTMWFSNSFAKLSEYRAADWMMLWPFEKNFVALRKTRDYLIFQDCFSLGSRRAWSEIFNGYKIHPLLFGKTGNIAKFALRIMRLDEWAPRSVWNALLYPTYLKKGVNDIRMEEALRDSTFALDYKDKPPLWRYFDPQYGGVPKKALAFFFQRAELANLTPDRLLLHELFDGGWASIFVDDSAFSDLLFEDIDNSYVFLWCVLFLCLFIFVMLFLATALNHPIYAVLYLVASFLGVFLLFLFLGLEYIGMLILLVYVGAIAVLMLFVLMLLDLKEIVLIKSVDLYFFRFIFFVSILFLLLVFSFSSGLGFVVPVEYDADIFSSDTGAQVWSEVSEHKNDIESIGLVLFTFFHFEFLLCAVVLYIPMIGVISMLQTLSPLTKRQHLFVQITRENHIRLIK